jgi:NAD(P)-dependent dehydrogenase (short-subunit alcohol dehydrogenase family)
MTKHEWKEVIDVHLNGTFELCHGAWPIMRDKQYGRIVNIASGDDYYVYID